MINKIFIFTSVIALAMSTRDHLTITEYNSAMDATVRYIADPVYRQLPLLLRNYSHEIFPPRQPGTNPMLLIRYNPPRFNVVLSDVNLKSIGSINREGECVIPDKNKQWEVNCWYKFKNLKFTAIGKQGEKFSEELDVTMAIASYKPRHPNKKGQIWHLWAPWAPASVAFIPTIQGSLSPELKKYLEDNNEDQNRFLEYFASEVESNFLNYDKLTDAFNRVLKEQHLDEDNPKTLDPTTSTRDHLTITEYNSAMDATVRYIADPVYPNLPLLLRNYSYEIFPPLKPGYQPRRLIRYNPPRFKVVLTDVHLNSIGSINREGECVIPDKNKQWEVNCWYKFKDLKFTAIGKQGEKFSEELDVTMVIASYKPRYPNRKGQIWHLWAPWAPASVAFIPKIQGSLSPELKQYLEDNNEDQNRFLEYFASEVESNFLNYDKLTDAFNRVLKEQHLDENNPGTLDPTLRSGQQRRYDTQADYTRRNDQFFRQEEFKAAV